MAPKKHSKAKKPSTANGSAMEMTNGVVDHNRTLRMSSNSVQKAGVENDPPEVRSQRGGKCGFPRI